MFHRPSRLLAYAFAAMIATETVSAAEPKEDPKTPMAPELISRVEASQLAEAALAECSKRGAPAAVLVTDSAGHMRAALSDDNAKLVGITSSRAKANAVVAFRMSTRALQLRAQSDQAFDANYRKDERYRFSPGGLPIYKNGKFVAVIAVGGAHSIDEECALAALQTLSWAATEPAAQSRNATSNPSVDKN